MLGDNASAEETVADTARAGQYSGAESDKVGKLFLQKGNIWFFQGKYDSALSASLATKRIYETEITKQLSKDDNIAAANMTIVGVYFSQGRMQEALEITLENTKVYERLDDQFNLSASYGNAGTIYLNQGNVADALEQFFKALEIAQKNQFTNITTYLGSIAQSYYYLKDHTRALTYAKQAVAVATKNNDRYWMAAYTSDVADQYRELGHLDSAFMYYQKSLEMHINQNNIDDQAYVLERMGSTYIDEERYEEAFQHVERGMALIKDRRLPEEELLLRVSLARCFLEFGQLDKALAEASRLRELAADTDKNTHKRNAYEAIHKVYSATGNLRDAYQFQEAYVAVNDSIFQEDKLVEVARAEYDFRLKREQERLETEQKQQQALYEQELEKERIVRLGAIVIILIVLALLVVLYRSYLIKQRSNQALSHKNEIINLRNEELTTRNEEISQLRVSEKQMAEETLALKERELTTITMLSHEKNNILTRLGEQVGNLTDKVDQKVLPDLREIKRLIKSNINDESWSMFTYQFEKVHPKFFNDLKDQFPALTQNDLRLCAYLKVGMGNKEIAQVSNITVAGVKKNINRMRKRLELQPEDNLREFLLGF